MSIAIKVSDVSKIYRIYDKPIDRLKQSLNKNMAYYKDFPALNKMSFEIYSGEAVGIVGRNGSGKSTLLQMIAGTLSPSSGKMEINGRIAALLELGSGFNPEFTGRENIYLNGAILGLTTEEMNERLDEILNFADIGDFIDQPVKTYSSGMYVRLAFAVSINVDPDILIVDEALAVGDGRFQLKCFEKIKALKKAGKTILVVSHDLQTIRQICDRVMLINQGEFIEMGNPNDVVNHYTKLLFSNQVLVEETTQVSIIEKQSKPQFARANTNDVVASKEYRYGNKQGIIEECVLLDSNDQQIDSLTTNDVAKVRIRVKALKNIPNPIYALTIKSVKGLEVYGTNSYFQNIEFKSLEKNDVVEIEFLQSMRLMPGDYFISLGFVELVDGDISPLDRRYDVLEMKILPKAGDRSFGIANLDSSIDIRYTSRIEENQT